MKIPAALTLSLAACATPAFAADARAPAQVMIVGTFHFSNPGHDQHNVKAVDVMLPARQAELQAVSRALSKFKPTLVAVEWPEQKTTERYADYLSGKTPSSNEVEQLGFRLAAAQGLKMVHGVDVDGDFPYEPVAAWADKNGMAARLAASHADIGKLVEKVSAMQQTKTLGATLKFINTEAYQREANAFYGDALRYGSGATQPGAALNSAWASRNFEICARLAQAIKPGERAVVFYGVGHAPLLKRCIQDIPGFQLVDAGKYL
jgi:hypothetical protein